MKKHPPSGNRGKKSHAIKKNQKEEKASRAAGHEGKVGAVLKNLVDFIGNDIFDISFAQFENRIRKALKEITQYCDAAGGLIFVYSDSADKIDLSIEWSRTPSESLLNIFRSSPQEFIRLFRTLSKKSENIIISDPHEYSDVSIDNKKAASRLGDRPMLYVPIKFDGLISGYLGSHGGKCETIIWPDELIPILKMIAQIFSCFKNYRKNLSVLKDSEERYKSLYNLSPDSMIIVDFNGIIMECNEAAVQMFKKNRHDITGKSVFEVAGIDKDIVPLYSNIIDNIKKGSKAKPIDLPFKIDNETKWLNVLSILLRKNGKPEAIQVILRATEKSARDFTVHLDSDAGYREYLQTADDAIVMTDIKGNVLFKNQAYYTIHGYEPGDETMSEGLKNILPDDRKMIRAKIKELLKKGLIKGEYRGFHKSGKIHHYRGTATLIRDHNEKPVSILASLRDITEQKTSEIVHSVITNITEVSNFNINMADLIGTIRKELGRLIDTTNFSIILYNEHDNSYRYPDITEENGLKSSDRKIMPKNPVDLVRRSMKPLKIDASNIEHLKKTQGIEYNISAGEVWMGVPLKAGGKLIGVATVQSRKEHSQYTDPDLHLFSKISNHIALAIERKCSEQAVRESEEKFRSIFHNANDIIVYLDKFGRILELNKEILFGYKREEFIGKSFRKLGIYKSKYIPVMLRHFKDIIGGATSLRLIQVEIIGKDGKTVFLEASGRVIKRNGKIEGVLNIVRDITARKEAEAALKASEEFNRAVIEHSPIGVSVRDHHGQLLSCNDAWKSIWGISKRKLDDYMRRERNELRFDEHDTYLADWLPAVKRIYRDGGYLHIPELKLRKRENEGRWVSQHFYAIKDDKGQVGRVVILTEDITERKRIDAALKESEEFSQAVIAHSPIGVSVRNPTGKLLGSNEAWRKIWPVSDENYQDFITRERKKLKFDERDNYLGKWKPEVEKIYKEGGYLYLPELRLTKPHDTSRWVSHHFYAIKDEKGKVDRVVILTEDITERKQAALALKESEERFRAVFETAQDAIFIKNREHIYTQVNVAMAWVLERPPTEIIGKNNYELWGPEEGKRITEIDSRVLAGETVEEISTRVVDGSPHTFHLVAVPMRGHEGEITGLCGIARDITHQRKMEEELAKSEKLESIGLLAGGIAHDFNNILTSILGNISLALMEIKNDSGLYELLADAEKATARAQNLTQQLLTFSKGGAPVKRTTSLKSLLTDLVNFALRGSNVKCEFDISDELSAVNIDIGQMSQVINNLVINADQAMPDGGIIKIAAKNVEAENEPAIASEKGKFIKISIVDQGEGIPEEHLGKIFDPYFTTKKRGSGLGLATTYSIIKNHDGYISVSSITGEGTTFDVYLPAALDRAIKDRKVVQKSVKDKCTGRILVMDDDSMILKITGILLNKLGYTASFARDGDEAIEIYKKAMKEGQPFDAAIFDLTVPGGMGGSEAIKKLKKIDPDICAIVSSGYSTDPVMADYIKFGFKGFAVKPYGIEELATAIKSVLTGNKEIADA